MLDLQRHHRSIAILMWIVYLTVNALVEAASVITEYARTNRELDSWEPYVWEFTSAASTGVLILAIVALNGAFPFRRDAWRRPLMVHLVATVPFSLLHVGGMVALRKLIYWSVGRQYDFGNLAVELPYEFRKDFVTYWFILGVLYLWQHVRFLHAARPEPDTEPSAPLERLFASKRGKEFVIRVADIDWIEAAGNYANLHHPDGVYPVRASMSELEGRLDRATFARVHRSFIVNLDRAGQIESTGSGDYRIHMRSGDIVRMSRRYRAQLRDRLNR